MNKRDKIIIAALVIVILALLVGLASMFINNSTADNGTVPDGMQKYNFDNRFTMAVPENARFLKDFNGSSEFGQGVAYFDRGNKIAILYVNSPLITSEIINYMINSANSSGNGTIEVEGDLILSHSLVNNGVVGSTLENSNFTDTVMIQKGHDMVFISSMDMNQTRAMAKTLEWYG